MEISHANPVGKGIRIHKFKIRRKDSPASKLLSGAIMSALFTALLTGNALAGILYVGSGNTSTPYLVGKYYTAGEGTNNPTFLSNTANGLSKSYYSVSDAAGNVYVANFGSNKVGKYDAATQTYNPSFLSVTGAWGLAVSGTTLYVGSFSGNTVAAYNTLTGSSIGGFTTITGLSSPIGLALDNSGGLLVANYGSGSVTKYNASSGGSSTGTVITGFTRIASIAIDASGNIYTCSDLTTTIGRYDAVAQNFNASYITSVPFNVYGIAVDNAGYLYDTDYINSRISRYNITNPSSGTMDTANYITGIFQPVGISYLSSVPEPSSVALLCIGSVAFVSWRVRKLLRGNS